MFKQALFLFLPVFLSAQNPNVIPSRPQAGEAIELVFDLSKSALQGAESVDVMLIEYSDGKAEAREVAQKRSGNQLHAIVTLHSKSQSVLAVLQSSDDRFDNNAGEGYFVPLCDATGKQRPESMAAQAVLYRDYGGMFELNRSATTALALYDRAFALQPDLKNKFLSSYASALMSAKRGEEGKNEVLQLFAAAEKDATMEEKQLLSMLRTYEKLGIVDKAKTLKEKIKTAYPKGQLARQERLMAAQNNSDLAKSEILLKEYAQDFPAQTDDDKNALSEAQANLCAKIGDQQEWEKFKTLASQLPGDKRASLYNNFAWEMAEKGESLEVALALSAEATNWTKHELDVPVAIKPAIVSEKTWKKIRRNNYGNYADTYAYVLDKTGDAAAAARYQAEAVAINEGKSADFNERYTAYLERANAPDLRYQLERFIMEGHATDKMKTQFKQRYASEDKSEAGSAAYLAGLEAIAKVNREKELAAQMIDLPAPAFTLRNLKGEAVSLESLRGKVVVVDFWATWCGPCKASFPGMQIAVNRYKSDADVVFLFVNTWEKATDKVKNAQEFIDGKNYSFQVLMDSEDKVVGAFGVSGIPTKFVIDRQGKIRFKAIGFDGGDQALADEVGSMIELARAQP